MQFKPHRPKYLSVTSVTQDELDVFHQVATTHREPTPTDFQNEGLDAATLKSIRMAYRLKYPDTLYGPWLRNEYRLNTNAAAINEQLAKTQNDAFAWAHDEGHISIESREFRGDMVIDTDLYITSLNGKTARLTRVKRRAKHVSSGKDDKLIKTTPIHGFCKSGTLQELGVALNQDELAALVRKELNKITKNVPISTLRYYFGRNGGTTVFEPTQATVMEAIRCLPWWSDMNVEYEDENPAPIVNKTYLVDGIRGDQVTLVEYPCLANPVTATLRRNIEILPASLVTGHIDGGYFYDGRAL